MKAECEPQYFGDESKKIIHGDALTELKKLPSESIDLIFADPPYNIGKDFDGMVESWDEASFLAWLYECIDECHRVLKTHGTMYIMNSTENNAVYRSQMPNAFLPSKAVSSGPMIVPGCRRKNTLVLCMNRS